MGQTIEDGARGLPGRNLGVRLTEVGAELGDGLIETGRRLMALTPEELGAAFGWLRLKAPFPGPAHSFATGARSPPLRSDILRDHKRWVAPAEPLARPGDFGGAERRTVRRGGSGLGRRAEG